MKIGSIKERISYYLREVSLNKTKLKYGKRSIYFFPYYGGNH